MTGKYFTYAFIFIFGMFIVLPMFWLQLKIRLKHLQKLTRLRVMRRLQKSENAVFFSSEILNKCCKLLFYTFDKKAHKALCALSVGKVQKAAEYMQTTQPQMSILLAAHDDAIKAYKKISKQKTLWLKNKEYCVYLPLLAHLSFDNSAMHTAISKIDPQNLSKCNQAYYDYCAAYAYLFDGDMLSASQRGSAALEYFRKRKYSYEGFMCYLLLGEIYRLSCVNDVSQTMIETALKINKEQKMPQFYAKSVAALGMLMLFENRHEEAEDKLNMALEAAQSENLKADIHNQKALLYIAQNKLTAAQKELVSALDTFERLKNAHGMAFALQLQAQIYFNKKQYTKALKAAIAATALYEKNRNISALLECRYLSADILFRQEKFKKAEEILRQIIASDKKQKHNFHIANAYSLLGLIYLRQKNLQRAKVLLQQSLHLEQRHRRCEGLVSDYTNLAVIDILSGNRDAAADNMKIALEYARQTGNEELLALIEKKSAALS